MKAQDVFTDDLHRCRPQRLELGFVFAVANRSDVVEQRVEPNVGDVRVVPRNVDSPVEFFFRARNGKIFEASANERDNLVAGRFGLNELGVLLIKVEQWLSEIAQLEKVVGFLQALDRAGVNGTDILAGVFAFAFDEVGFGFVLFTADAVVTFVRTAVDEAGVIEVLQELLHIFLVARLGGANEVLVIDVDGFKKWQPGIVNKLVCPGLWGAAVADCGAKNLFTVLIGSS